MFILKCPSNVTPIYPSRVVFGLKSTRILIGVALNCKVIHLSLWQLCLSVVCWSLQSFASCQCWSAFSISHAAFANPGITLSQLGGEKIVQFPWLAFQRVWVLFVYSDGFTKEWLGWYSLKYSLWHEVLFWMVGLLLYFLARPKSFWIVPSYSECFFPVLGPLQIYFFLWSLKILMDPTLAICFKS